MQSNPSDPKRQRRLTIIYIGTALVALALYRGLGLPIVVSFLLGFAIVAVTGLAVFAIAEARRDDGKSPPTD